MLYSIGKLCLLFFLVELVFGKFVPMLRDDDDEAGELNPEDYDDVGNRHNEESTHDEDGNPDFFEGDVVNGNAEDRDAAFNKKWPKKKGLVYVPYTIPKGFSKANRKALANVIAEYEENTCVRLVKRSGEKDYVHLQTTDSGCFVWTIGNTGGKQVLNDGSSCSWGNMVHEFMHKLGFYHEQTRPDRDKFITIKWDNLEKYEKKQGVSSGKWKSQFKACTGFGCKVSTTNYDYGSIMHYSPYMGSYQVMKAKSNCPNPPCKIKYQRSRLSKLDIEGINAVYGCNGKKQCEDVASKANYCKTNAKVGGCNGKYKDFFAVNCPKTCNKCP